MKNFRPKQAPRHPYLRFRGGASQLTAANRKLIGKGLWMLQFTGDKAEQTMNIVGEQTKINECGSQMPLK